MKKLFKKIRNTINNQRGEIGIATILGIIFMVVVFVFVVLPQGRTFVTTMFTDLTTWYNGLNLFPTS